jgi:hypothetical protein
MFAIGACLAIGLAAVGSAAVDQPAKADAVRELDTKGLKLTGMDKGTVKMPTKITSAEELAKTVTDKDAQKAIAKQVDFGKEYLLYFAWQGSGGDQITFKATQEKTATKVVFSHKTGMTFDLRPHAHMYVLPKDATWTVEHVK